MWSKKKVKGDPDLLAEWIHFTSPANERLNERLQREKLEGIRK